MIWQKILFLLCFCNQISAREENLVKTFKNEKEWFQSSFWKIILAKKQPSIAKKTLIHVLENNKKYVFGPSEINNDVITGFPTWLFKRNVELYEVEYGTPTEYDLSSIPFSSCVSSEYSSMGGSFTFAYQWADGISIKTNPKVSMQLLGTGINIVGEVNAVQITNTFNSRLTCKIPAGGKVQIFGTHRLYYYSDAKLRRVIFLSGNNKFEYGEWEKIETFNFEQNASFGPLFLDGVKEPKLECVTLEQYQKCDEEINVWNELRNQCLE